MTSSSSSSSQSSTTNYGHVDDEPAHFSYQDGALSWGDGSSKLIDENIICVMALQDSSIAHSIFSLAPIEEGSQKPFELRITNTTLLPQDFLEQHLFKDLPAYLQPDNDIHVLISNLSGTGLAPSFFDDVLHPILLAIGLADSQYTVSKTTDAKSIIQFSRNELLPAAIKGRQQTVLMLSGDGGLVDTINGLLETGKPSE
jgi:hypothetical protein